MDNNNERIPMGSEDNASRTPAPMCYAVGSLALGILAMSLILLYWSGISSMIGGFVFGITGTVFANKAGKAGCKSSIGTAGLALSIISIVMASLSIALCVGIFGCYSCLVCAGASYAGMM